MSNMTTEEKTMHCSGCGKEILEKDALRQGFPAQTSLDPNWRQYAKCEDCDYRDYKNTYGGM